MGLATAQRCVAAQEPGSVPEVQSSAAQDAKSSSNKNATQPAQKQEKGEDDNVYRHTALVTSIAKAINLPVETTARLFEFINFAILALAILIPLFKVLPKVFRKRDITLSANLETARKTSADANTRLSAVEAQLSKLDEEIAKIRAQVEDESRQDEARIKASIEEESARIVASAEQEIGVAAAQAKRGLRHFAADLAIEQATKQLVLTPETDRALIAEFINDAAQNGSKGGQN
ncbi:MAG TPA: ATP synthase F0 subunit B [Terracidiphilus sp.]